MSDYVTDKMQKLSLRSYLSDWEKESSISNMFENSYLFFFYLADGKMLLCFIQFALDII